MSSESNAVLRYFPNLDGLRAIAALSVTFYHAAGHIAFPDNAVYRALQAAIGLNGQGGQIGVHFFFILSGFLITYLMFLERQDTGKFALKAFYVRRILRIWPLYYATLIIGFVTWFFVGKPMETMEAIGRWLHYVFFLANVDIITNNHAMHQLVFIHWSVAIEEQFYLVWPALFLITPRKWFPAMCVVMMAISLTYYQMHTENAVRMALYFSTFSAVSSFASGGLLAWFAFHYQEKIKSLFTAIPPILFPLLSAFTLGFLALKGRFIDAYHMPKLVYHVAEDVLFTIILAEQCFNPKSMLRAGSSKVLDWIGKMSYGVYLLHIPSLMFSVWLGEKLGLPALLQLAMTIVFALSISWLSFNYFEKPFNKLRKKFSHLVS